MRRPASAAPELPGYTYMKLLGSGGFSDVFLYEQHLPRRRVAVKVLLTEGLSVSSRAAFVGEANLMAQLSAHPYIVTIHHADVAGDRPYFVMEYCSGPSLSERYKGETMAIADVLRTGVRLSSAVSTAHAAGILHRDIKPANVLTNDFGWPALTDFGISSAVDDAAFPLHTGTLADAIAAAEAATEGTGSAAVGMSVPWSPPEMFDDDPRPDVRSDLFSLAATIYTVVAGHTPFEVPGRSNGTLDLIGRIERGAITPLTRPDVPRSLAAVLAKGMAPDRADRFVSALDFARALQRVELELGYAPTTIDVAQTLIESPPRGGPDDAEETRVREVATIEAQPEPPRPRLVGPPPDAVPEPSAADAATVVRGATRVVQQDPSSATSADVLDRTVVRRRSEPAIPERALAPGSAGEPGSEPQPPAQPSAQPSVQPSRARRVGLVAGVGALLVIGLAIVAGVTIGGGASAPRASSPPASTGGPAVVEGIPSPSLASAAADGGTVVFTVTNPEPQEGDSFTWRRLFGSQDEPVRRVADGRIVVDGYSQGQTVCIEASVLRAGDQSANPLEACFPDQGQG